MSDRHKGTWQAWAELVRPPNLPTVPGDPLAGFALCAAAQGGLPWRVALPAAAAATLLYAAGLLWNDCADYAEDLRDRPSRPLPSGRVRRAAALVAGAILAVGGVGAAAAAGPACAVAAAALAGLVALYDFATRRGSWTGFATMGACRGASVLVGAAAAAPPDAWPASVPAAAAGAALFIALVSRLAATETDATAPRGGVSALLPWLPAAGYTLWIAATFAALGRVPPLSGEFAALGLAWLLYWGYALLNEKVPVGRAIGAMIRTLLLAQAALCASAPGGAVPAAALVLIGWPLSAALARRFKAS